MRENRFALLLALGVTLCSCGNAPAQSSSSLISSEASSMEISSVPSSSKEEPSSSSSESSPIVSSSETSVVPQGYQPRKKDYAYFKCPDPVKWVGYYWYFNYGDDGFEVTVDIVDDNDWVFDNPDMGYNDNVELTLQPNTSANGLVQNVSLNILADSYVDLNWARFASDDKNWGSNIYSDLRNRNLLRVDREENEHCFTINWIISYQNWGKTRDNLLGEITVNPAARNSSSNGDTHYRNYIGHDTVIMHTAQAVRVKEDGSLCKNYFDKVDLEELVRANGTFPAGKTLKDNMAKASSNTAVRQVGHRNMMFDDRHYLFNMDVVPAALLGKSFMYGPINNQRTLTVDEAGFVVIAMPTTTNKNLIASIKSQGFAELASDQPICSTAGAYQTITSDAMSYLVKWCNKGEIVTANGSWAIICFASLAIYENDDWMINPCQIDVIDSNAMFNKHLPSSRQWQGMPVIEEVKRDDGGYRLFSSFYSGGYKEPQLGNYCIVYFSDDNGVSWNFLTAIGYFEEDAYERTYDTTLFTDDQGNLWITWVQADAHFYRTATFYTKITNPGVAISSRADNSKFNFTSPAKLADGSLNTRIRILEDGTYCFVLNEFENCDHALIYFSKDKGKTWYIQGTAYQPTACFGNEACIAETYDEKGNKMFVLYVRRNSTPNMMVQYSYDYCKSWTDAAEFEMIVPNSRHATLSFTRGGVNYLFLIGYYNTYERAKITVHCSTDGGKSWPHRLILDNRTEYLTYPDIIMAHDGSFYVTYDHQRGAAYDGKPELHLNDAKEIHLMNFTLDDVLASGDGDIYEGKIKSVCALNFTGQLSTISGYVTDESGNPVSNAKVSIKGTDTFVRTDANGYYEFVDELAREMTLSVTKSGFVTSTSKLDKAAFIDANFRYLRRDIKLISL